MTFAMTHSVNRIYISNLVFLFFITTGISQVPVSKLTIDCGVPDISSITAGDRDRDGDNDLFVSSITADKIVQIQNDSGLLSPVDFLAVDNPAMISMNPINSADNFYYSTQDENGITFLFGFNPYFPGGATRKLLADSVGKVTNTAFGIVPYEPTPQEETVLMTISDRADRVYFVETFIASFGEVGIEYIGAPFSFQDPVQAVSRAQNDTLEFLITDPAVGGLVSIKFSGTFTMVHATETSVLPLNSIIPYGIASYSGPGSELLFISDQQSKKLHRQIESGNSITTEVVDSNLINPGLLYLFDIEGDSLPELFLIDSNQLWMYSSDITRGTAGRMLIAETTAPIANIWLGDITGDEQADIAIAIENSGDLVLFSDDEFSGNRAIQVIDGRAFPNPVVDKLFLDHPSRPTSISLTDRNGLIFPLEANAGAIEIGHLANGLYLLEYQVDNRLYRQKIAIQR